MSDTHEAERCSVRMVVKLTLRQVRFLLALLVNLDDITTDNSVRRDATNILKKLKATL